jgi:tRNA threonylcarbamoyladenosine biosynthesis protein TsaB
MKLLALDTASGQCSVALLLDGQLAFRGVATAREHAQLLLPMVDALLAEAGLTLHVLDGIAFGRGPGSFTGVRIAAAVTQGLAAGADLPVLPVSSLRALAAQARRLVTEAEGAAPDGALLACMDARMGELYWAVFAPDLKAAPEVVGPPQQLLVPPHLRAAAAAGKGLAAWPDIAVSLQLPPARVFAGAEPHAREVAWLAAQDLAQGASWLDAALAQPVYLRDQVVQAAKTT